MSLFSWEIKSSKSKFSSLNSHTISMEGRVSFLWKDIMEWCNLLANKVCSSRLEPLTLVHLYALHLISDWWFNGSIILQNTSWGWDPFIPLFCKVLYTIQTVVGLGISSHQQYVQISMNPPKGWISSLHQAVVDGPSRCVVDAQGPWGSLMVQVSIHQRSEGGCIGSIYAGCCRYQYFK